MFQSRENANFQCAAHHSSLLLFGHNLFYAGHGFIRRGLEYFKELYKPRCLPSFQSQKGPLNAARLGILLLICELLPHSEEGHLAGCCQPQVELQSRFETFRNKISNLLRTDAKEQQLRKQRLQHLTYHHRQDAPVTKQSQAQA